jgi:hypothetical protein
VDRDHIPTTASLGSLPLAHFLHPIFGQFPIAGKPFPESAIDVYGPVNAATLIPQFKPYVAHVKSSL